MDTLQIVFQVLTVITTVLAICQRDKWKIMLFYTFENVICVAMYFAFNRTAAAMICVVATFRTIIYMIYSLKNLKPNLVWLFLFGVAYITVAVITWQDMLDILPLIAMLSVNFGSWQDKQLTLRIFYIIDHIAYITYKFIIGAYIAMGVEIFCLIVTTIALVYYCILKKEKPLLDYIFRRKRDLKSTNQL